MTKIHCVKSDNYEALYINGKLYDEGNPLNEGIERVLYFYKLSQEYGVFIFEIKFGYINLAENTDYGEFPNDLYDIINFVKWDN